MKIRAGRKPKSGRVKFQKFTVMLDGEELLWFLRAAARGYAEMREGIGGSDAAGILNRAFHAERASTCDYIACKLEGSNFETGEIYEKDYKF